MPQPAKPNHLKILHGDRKDRINYSEPVPDKGEVKPPYKLPVKVQKVWDRLAPDRIRKGVLTPWDTDAFAMFCEGVVLAQEAMKLVRKGVMVKGARRGEPVYNRAYQGLRETMSVLTTLGGKFGWTPSDRAKLIAPGGKDASGVEDLLS